MPVRIFLIVSAASRDAIDAARASNADAVVVDLSGASDADRATLGLSLAALKSADKQVYVRLSSMSSGNIADDLAAALGESLDGIVYPDTQSARDVRQLDVLIREQEMKKQVKPGAAVLIPEIASAKGLLRCEEIVQASSRIAGLALDGDAYAVSLGVVRSANGAELAYARGVIVTVCAAYGLTSIDTAGGDTGAGFKAKYATSVEEISRIRRLRRVVSEP